ncbi:hypothetical protein J2Z42_001263 [Clostridium algifaecis]|uniref:Uncharacterized protein n=1 Tax=Clostridium algifaecis TaxID=1472040 RepID=A0ABS4KT03_9CLOT|nr:hypothetical protein [Clostridium algifaecis]
MNLIILGIDIIFIIVIIMLPKVNDEKNKK